ncbi:hypothetical protein GBAR_LOCUS1423 [Geodia barretti]|uniref:Uncharacterized protein n=1 Tax=Geodia barretti TaxID=519541 RepID=A0AA35QX96_GEOBA|nr:hypothetical protein GBAR_LOCUS1423 [Geodia barretti]
MVEMNYKTAHIIYATMGYYIGIYSLCIWQYKRVSGPSLPWQTLPWTRWHTSTWRERRQVVQSC